MLVTICCLFTLANLAFSAQFRLLEQNVYDLRYAEDIFDQFTLKYDKVYENDEQKTYRYNVFKDNLEKINTWNEERGTKMFSVNAFTDLTSEEFSDQVSWKYENVTLDDKIDFKRSGLKSPSSLDWRNSGYVTEPKNQLSCGSCFAFSAIGNIEGQYAKAHGGGAFSLSNQQGLDCDTAGSCNGGQPHKVFQALASQGGCMRETDYPYQDAKGQCHTDKSKIAVVVTGGNPLSIYSENDLKEAVANTGPLSIIIAYSPEMQHIGSEVFKPTNCNSNKNHAVLLIGYGNDGMDDYWIIKNSWGTSWGSGGYFRLIRGQKACNIGMYAATSTVS